MKKLTYQEALEFSLKVEWKVSFCPQGEQCWCRIIEPKTKIETENDEEVYIAGAGEISTIHAEHIVEVHNNYIKSVK